MIYEPLGQIRYQPIDHWPGKLRGWQERRRSPFSAKWHSTVALLGHELRQIGARQVVLQVAIGHGEIRADGLPYARARPDHPGIILSFELPDVGPLAYPCDTFDDWRDNIRAVALTLEHLRAVERYGVTRTHEQYRGWLALPPPGAPAFTSADQAAEWLVGRAAEAGVPLDTGDLLDLDGPWLPDAYRAAARRLHPDTPTGSRAEWDRLQEAKRLIEASLQKERT